MEIRGVPTLNGKVRSTIPFVFLNPSLRHWDTVRLFFKRYPTWPLPSKQLLQICNNANMQNVQRVQNIFHQISNVAAALLNLPKQLSAPIPQNHSCHQSDLQWRRHKVVNLPALEKKTFFIQLFRDGVTSLTPESRDIFSLHTAQTGKKVQEKWKKTRPSVMEVSP